MSETPAEDAFDPNIPRGELPPNWKAESKYDSSVYLQSPDGEVEHVILQRWGDEYLVEPMIAADDVSGATAKNDPNHAETFTTVGNAVNYALDQASRLAKD